MAARRRGPSRRWRAERRKDCWIVQEWKNAWKWFSVQIMLLMAAAQGLLVFVPTLKDYIHPTLWHGLMSLLAILAIIGRVVNQTPKGN